ncbi:MAG: transcription termination factor Rho [Bacteroidota bacterium]
MGRRSSRGPRNKKNRAPETPFRGMLEMIGDKPFGFLREFRQDLPKGDNDPFVPPPIIRKYNLRDGVMFEGMLKPSRRGAKQVSRVTRVMGLLPEEWRKTKKFESGNVIYPDEKLNLVTSPRDVSMRVVDLACPLGKGQRALIVSPPRAGKTIMMKQIAAAIAKNHPGVELVALLVDERPEEVTDFRRTTAATVFASSNDREEDNHVRVATLALEYAKRLVEQKKDVVLLLDSLTRLGRSFNMFMGGGGRTLSGGLDSNAMKIPRKIFGSARNIEGGGSLTIIATALIETGSRMDEVIFEEFKGTGNAEIVLDRRMADKRIFPAVNLRKSGTRNEERLIGDLITQHHRLFRALNSRPPHEAMQALLRHIQQTPTNEVLLNELIPD